jgi:hypothetical protein
MKRMASEGGTSKSSGSSIDAAGRLRPAEWSGANFALCVDAGGNIDLDLRKVYRVRKDERSFRQGFIRIIDESGEDYLYPMSFFLPLRLSERAAKAFRQLA